MWNLTVPFMELVGRAALTYIFLLALLRITGKRQVGQLAPFDLILLLILSNAVQNAMNGGDNSFTAGIVSAATLVALNGLVGWATYRSKWLEGLIEGRPRVLIHNGRILDGTLRAERMTHHELMAVELFAWALLLWPDASAELRLGAKLRKASAARRAALASAWAGASPSRRERSSSISQRRWSTSQLI